MARSYIFTLPEILYLWCRFSETIEASWIIPYNNDDHVFEAIMQVL